MLEFIIVTYLFLPYYKNYKRILVTSKIFHIKKLKEKAREKLLTIIKFLKIK